MSRYEDMTKEERAEYMRQYRARKAGKMKQAQDPAELGREVSSIISDVEARDRRIAELEDEVRRLKQELSKAKMPALATGVAEATHYEGPLTATPRGVSSQAGGTPHGPNRGGQRRGSGEGRAGGSTPARSPDPSASEHDDGRPVFHPEKASPERLSKAYFARKRKT